MASLTLALFQANSAFRSAQDVLFDLALAMERAASKGADMLVTPELFFSGYGSVDAVKTAAQVQDSEYLKEIGKLANHYKLGLVLGYPEKCDQKLYNSAAVFAKNGTCLVNYRKVALANEFERDCFSPGSSAQLFEFDGVRCSVLICYDIEFPELTRRSANLGTELLLVPTALRSEWRIVSDAIVPARAYENSMFIGYCDYANDGCQLKFSGTSSICAPNGQYLSRASGEDDLILATIDTIAVQMRKAEFDFLDELKFIDSKVPMVKKIA